MKKADVLRELKNRLKNLEEAKEVKNLDYHRGRMDELKGLIKDFEHPIQGKRFSGMSKRYPG